MYSSGEGCYQGWSSSQFGRMSVTPPESLLGNSKKAKLASRIPAGLAVTFLHALHFPSKNQTLPSSDDYNRPTGQAWPARARACNSKGITNETFQTIHAHESQEGSTELPCRLTGGERALALQFEILSTRHFYIPLLGFLHSVFSCLKGPVWSFVFLVDICLLHWNISFGEQSPHYLLHHARSVLRTVSGPQWVCDMYLLNDEALHTSWGGCWKSPCQDGGGRQNKKQREEGRQEGSVTGVSTSHCVSAEGRIPSPHIELYWGTNMPG